MTSGRSQATTSEKTRRQWHQALTASDVAVKTLHPQSQVLETESQQFAATHAANTPPLYETSQLQRRIHVILAGGILSSRCRRDPASGHDSLGSVGDVINLLEPLIYRHPTLQDFIDDIRPFR